SVLAGINKVIESINDEFSELSRKIWQYKSKISKSLQDSGFDLTDSVTPITSIRSGNSLDTLLLAKELFENKILSTPFVYPSVPYNEGRIRLIAGANLSESTINTVTEIFRNIRRK
nr:aminotransferase class I/II-fold pyridoxal phosphate-dependent enzyme [Bacteroidota bacterium]